MNTISTATGLVSIYANNKQAVALFVILAHQSLKYSKYATYLTFPFEEDDHEPLTIDDLWKPDSFRKLHNYIEETDKGFRLTLSFSAFGQSNFSNNIRDIFKDIAFLSPNIKTTEVNVFDLMSSLTKERIYLEFDYNDVDIHHGWLSKMHVEVEKPINKQLSQCDALFYELSDTEIEFSAKNLKKYLEINCFGTDVDSIPRLIEALNDILDDEDATVDERQSIQAIFSLLKEGTLSLADQQGISNAIQECSSDYNVVVYDDDYDNLRGTDLISIINDYWETICALDAVVI